MRISALLLFALTLLVTLFGMFFSTAEHPTRPRHAIAWGACVLCSLLLFALAAGLFDPLLPAR